MRSLAFVVCSLTVLAACSPPAEDAAERLQLLEQDLGRLEERLNQTQAALPPGEGEPAGEQQPGEPFPLDPGMPIDDEPPGVCPQIVNEFAVIRLETGNNCAGYASEVSSFVSRCTDVVDRQACCDRAIRIAAGRCSQWCTSKGCGARVTFFPPPACKTHGSFRDENCADDCSFKEWCTLILTDRVLNCYCQDRLPV